MTPKAELTGCPGVTLIKTLKIDDKAFGVVDVAAGFWSDAEQEKRNDINKMTMQRPVVKYKEHYINKKWFFFFFFNSL